MGGLWVNKGRISYGISIEGGGEVAIEIDGVAIGKLDFSASGVNWEGEYIEGIP